MIVFFRELQPAEISKRAYVLYGVVKVLHDIFICKSPSNGNNAIM